MADFMLTTTDNPWNPFTRFDDWYAFDEAKGYHTCSYLARITRTSDELSDEDKDLAIDEGMEEILKYNILGVYKKITKDDVIDLDSLSDST